MLRTFLVVSILMLGACADRVSLPPLMQQTTLPATVNFAPLTTIPAVSPDLRRALCRARPDSAFQRRVPVRGLDRAILDRAILYHTNLARCGRGLQPLTADASLRQIATGHSADMVRFGFFGHTSPVPGKTTVSDRLREGGIAFGTAAENLATIKRLTIRGGQPVYPLGYDRCAYSLTPYGPRLPVRTYDDMARSLVERWIASPGHRKNLMNPLYTRHGASGIIDPNADLCESVNATQLFAG